MKWAMDIFTCIFSFIYVLILQIFFSYEVYVGSCSFLTASVVLGSEFLATDPEARVRFRHYQKNFSGSGTVSTQPREYN
jgi:hypothetical protein